MMSSQLETFLSKVLKKITPNVEERERILKLAEKLEEKVQQVARETGLDVEVHLEGSVAKDTWLREAPDIDIFIRVPSKVNRESFGTTYLNVAKKATVGAKQVERFAEHPYLEAIFDGTRVNIVPCYRVKKGKWKSATDRTPFHTDYVKPLLNERLRGEVRLLKRFMKGIDVYGAEIKIGGFSGYLCELLILYYDSFLQALKSVGDWKTRAFIDLEGHYEGRERELGMAFDEPLVVVDPVDSGRNAASAVRREQLDTLVAASRAFLNNPNMTFFYPPKKKPLSPKALIKTMKDRGTNIVLTQFGEVETVPDILWGQLYKSQRALRKLVEQYDFKAVRDSVWSDEKSLNIYLLEVEDRFLPTLKKHLGPPLEKREECERFLEKHSSSAQMLSGPRIEEGRWVVYMRRRYEDVVALLGDALKDGGRKAGVAELVSKSIARRFKVTVNEEILPTYSQNRKFARFLTEYLEGRPKWLG
jgi:tRNA nucleotidyltransferase (CCA-adding enzyme)